MVLCIPWAVPQETPGIPVPKQIPSLLQVTAPVPSAPPGFTLLPWFPLWPCLPSWKSPERAVSSGFSLGCLLWPRLIPHFQLPVAYLYRNGLLFQIWSSVEFSAGQTPHPARVTSASCLLCHPKAYPECLPQWSLSTIPLVYPTTPQRLLSLLDILGIQWFSKICRVHQKLSSYSATLVILSMALTTSFSSLETLVAPITCQQKICPRFSAFVPPHKLCSRPSQMFRLV